MGRLFWKFFFVLWLGIALGALLVMGGIRLVHLVDPALAVQGLLGDVPTAPTEPPPLWPPLLGTLVSSALLGALMAWYVSHPIRNLTWAFEQLASGRLDTRVHSLMGRRRDELAQLGLEFDRMADRLQMLVGAQNRLLHDISHELRSPLARMQAAIGVTRQQPGRADGMLDRIDREARRLDALVGELLTLARLEAGTHAVATDSIDVIALVADICDDASFEAIASGRDVSFVGDDIFMARVEKELLQRAYENVIRNAIKYTREGSIVRVEAQVVASVLVVTVADEGPGISAEGIEHIFEPFKRVGQPGTEGFGLGLSIAKRAMEFHGGGVDAASPPGGGLVVKISLPETSPALRLSSASGCA